LSQALGDDVFVQQQNEVLVCEVLAAKAHTLGVAALCAHAGE